MRSIQINQYKDHFFQSGYAVWIRARDTANDCFYYVDFTCFPDKADNIAANLKRIWEKEGHRVEMTKAIH